MDAYDDPQMTEVEAQMAHVQSLKAEAVSRLNSAANWAAFLAFLILTLVSIMVWYLPCWSRERDDSLPRSAADDEAEEPSDDDEVDEYSGLTRRQLREAAEAVSGKPKAASASQSHDSRRGAGSPTTARSRKARPNRDS